METILVANSGSSSVKFQVFEIDAGHRLVRQIKGKVEGIGTKPHLGASGADGKVLVDRHRRYFFLNEINESAHRLVAEGMAATAKTGGQGS